MKRNQVLIAIAVASFLLGGVLILRGLGFSLGFGSGDDTFVPTESSERGRITVRGTVVNPDGSPAPGVTVGFYDPGIVRSEAPQEETAGQPGAARPRVAPSPETPILEVETDSEGRYEFEAEVFLGGRYEVKAGAYSVFKGPSRVAPFIASAGENQVDVELFVLDSAP
ncbi:MAG: hypothetical protein AAF561_01565 [Planctomycetota bacterium]